MIDYIRICLVNGNEVKTKYWMDFVEGGNDMVYGKNSKKAFNGTHFMPDKEIWLDANIDISQLPFICLHEYYERYLMETKNLSYEQAHKKADKLEKHYRETYKI